MCKESILPTQLKKVHSPLQCKAWQALLFPTLTNTLWDVLQGIQNGFRNGFVGLSRGEVLKSRNSTMLSALESADVVSKYLEEEMHLGRIMRVGSVDEATRLGVHCSPSGVIPKKSKPDINYWSLFPQG